MAAHLKWCAMLALLGAPSIFAQSLGDPTRPPHFGGRAPAATAPESGYSSAQVVVISKDRRQVTINGQIVSLGERYGNATVVGISDEEIVLQRAEATEIIKLYSAIQRTQRRITAREPSSAPGRREEGIHEAN